MCILTEVEIQFTFYNATRCHCLLARLLLGEGTRHSNLKIQTTCFTYVVYVLEAMLFLMFNSNKSPEISLIEAVAQNV